MRLPDFSPFPNERERKLKNIHRYSMFEVMFYRSSLSMHTRRVHWIVDAMLPRVKKALPTLDGEKARTLALVHDDAEIVIGDYQAGHKAKMTPAQLKKIEEAEEHAIHQLAKKYPKTINGYSYETLLLHAARKDCLEAQFVSYVDRLDAYCETLHEILAGNISFLWSLMLYDRWTAAYTTRYPALKPLMADKKSPFILGDNRYEPYFVRAKKYAQFGNPHTAESILKATDFPFYNEWRKTVLKRGGAEGKKWLIEQREFLR